MRKMWTAPTLKDFNVLSLKRSKPISEVIEPEVMEPKSASDLTVNPRKIQEIKKWLKANINQQSAILLVCGPSGSGKATTLKLVASAEGITVKEWINPLSKTISNECFGTNIGENFGFTDISEAKKFEDFILRCSRYPSLFQEVKHSIITVKDIPNAFLRRPDLFHDFIKKYKIFGKCPIVFIITDDENLDLNTTLFPNELKNSCCVSIIKFNPVSDSFIKKSLKTLCDKYKKSHGALALTHLEVIAKNSAGDIRSAMTDMLMEMRTGEIANKKNAKKRKFEYLSDCEVEPTVVNLKPTRDHGYDFYKKMGRILYPKRKEERLISVEDKFVHNFFEISENWSSYYNSFLHENYLHTCTKLEDVAEAANYFSFCDTLVRHSEVENICSTIIVAGLMTANTFPKKNGFFPFRKSVNIPTGRDITGNFNTNNILRFGLDETVYALDIAPVKKWLFPEEQYFIATSSRFINGLDQLILPKTSKMDLPHINNQIDVDNENLESGEEDNLEIEED